LPVNHATGAVGLSVMRLTGKEALRLDAANPNRVAFDVSQLNHALGANEI
jgi:hypothetical protein